MIRRFQFSLRALLVIVTMICLLLGLQVERARRRTAAIDFVVNSGCAVDYLNDSGTLLRKGGQIDHFWSDLTKTPVYVRFSEKAWSGDSLKPAITTPLARIYGIQGIGLIVQDGKKTLGDEKKRTAYLQRIVPGAVIDTYMIVY